MEEVSEAQCLENYELMLIFLSDLGEEGIKKELDELRKHLSSDGGEILNEDIWGNRELAYRIKKQDRGFYCLLNFRVGTDKIAELQRNLTISPAVIRFLLMKTPVDYVFKTNAEYQALVEQDKEARETAKREKEAKRDGGRRPADAGRFQRPGTEKKSEAAPKKTEPKVTPVKETVKEVEPATEKVAEKAEVKAVEPEEAPKKVERKPRRSSSAAESKIKLEDVDAKLKSIIDDPDITL